MIPETKRIRKSLLRLRPMAALIAAAAWILFGEALNFMQTKGWVVVATVSGGYLLSMIMAHAGFVARSVFLKERDLFIEEGRVWNPLSWLTAVTIMVLGFGVSVELFLHRPPKLAAAGLMLGGAVYAKVLRPEMIKLHRQLRNRKA